MTGQSITVSLETKTVLIALYKTHQTVCLALFPVRDKKGTFLLRLSYIIMIIIIIIIIYL
jgi:hypothetical protein